MKSSFQTILVIIFAVVFIAAVLIFSGLISFGTKSTSSNTPQGTVVMWGTVPQEAISGYLDNFNISNGDTYTISYSQHSKESLSQDIIVALANGNPPDLIIFSSEIFSQFKDKLYTIPYSGYSERAFRDTNIDGAQVFLTKDGIIGLPITVDPIVMYYNKDILAQASFVVPPKTWSTMQAAVPLLTKKDARNSILQSTVALGTGQNVVNVKDILSTLFMQTGSSIVSYDASSNTYRASIGQASGVNPTAQALEFYTSFANPTNANYSWNNALPSSIDQFVAGKSAFYIGRASELFAIQSRNPNLNFDVTEILQTDTNARPVTFGSFLAVGMLKNAPNPVAAYAAATYLTNSASIDTLSKALSLAPARRDLLLVQQNNPYVAVFFKAALSAFAWPDPNPSATEKIFRDMITSVTSGKTDPNAAIYQADTSIQSLLR